MNRTAPRRAHWWLLLPLLLAALAVLHTGLWRSAATTLAQGIDDWAAQRRAQGWVVQHGMAERGGWPFAVTLKLPDFALTGGATTNPPNLTWRAEALEFRVSLPNWDRLVVAPRGRQSLALPGLDLPFAADRLELTLPLERGAFPREGMLDTERLRLNSPFGAFEVRRGSLSVQTRSSATETEPALSLDFRAADVTLPIPGPGALGQKLDRLELEASLSGPLPTNRHPTQRAEAWRDAGGTLDLRHAEIQWGPVTATLAATGTLDEALQPMGAGQLRLIGAAEAVDALVAAGWLPRNVAGASRAMAALLARPRSDGGPPVLELPVTLQERRVGLSRLPLARLPALAWPAPPEMPDAARDPSLPGTD